MNTKTCPACGADVPADALQCPFCDSSQVPVSLSHEQREQTLEFIRHQNTRLLETRKSVLRKVDLLGALAALGGMTILWLGMLAFDLSNSKTWLVIYLAAILTGWWLLRRRRLVSGLINFYRQNVDPPMAEYANRIGLPRWQLDQMTARELPPGAPLRKFMFSRSGDHE